MTTTTSSIQQEQAQARLCPRPTGFDVLRIVLGLVLLTAAVLKGWQLATEPTLEKGLLTSRWFLIVGVEVEWLLSLWLLSGLYKQQAWWAAVGCFTFFTGITLYKALSGEASCGCFGKVEISPWYTLGLDTGCLALLVICRQQRLHDAGQSAVPQRITWVLAAVLVGLAGVWGMASHVPATMDESGQILGNDSVVVLEPEQWANKRFPLLGYIDIGQDLARGRWLVIFYSSDCQHCIQELPEYQRLAKDIQASGQLLRVMFLELPPYERQQSSIDRQVPYAVGRLDETRRWFVTTPAAVLLKDLRVLMAKENASARDVAEWLPL